MTNDEMKALYSIDKGPDFIGPVGGDDRTLLYGWDCDGRTWHVYQQDGELCHAIYLGSNPSFESFNRDPELIATSLVPNKRLYPEACDFEFCRRLKELGVHLPFATYGTLKDIDSRRPFIGRTF